jgi:hypothetical protein
VDEGPISDDEDENDAAVMALVVHVDKLLSECYSQSVGELDVIASRQGGHTGASSQ